MNLWLAFCVGWIIAILFIFLIMLPTSPRWMEENRAIVYTTSHGIICKENKNYPKLNCVLIKEAVGPKLNTFKIKENK